VPELVLLLPDLHSALSHRNGPSIPRPREHATCPSVSDHEICMNHVTSTIHGKQRLRQYVPKDKIKKAVPEDEEASTSAKKPVTFQPAEQSQSRDRDQKGTGERDLQ